MNLQDRILEILEEYYGKNPRYSGKAAKAILALVESKHVRNCYCQDDPRCKPPTVSGQEHIYTQDDSGLCNCDCHDKPVEPTAPIIHAVPLPHEGSVTTAPVGDWESEFDQRFGMDKESVAHLFNYREALIDFIRETIKNREREIAEGVEGMRWNETSSSKFWDSNIRALTRSEGQVYNKALDGVLTLINKQ